MAAEERREVRAVRDVRDRHVAARPANMCRHMSRATAPWSSLTAVPAAAQPERELRHARLLGRVAGSARNRPRNPRSPSPSRSASPPYAAMSSSGEYVSFPAGDRRVRREDDPPSARPRARPRGSRPAATSSRRELERRERRMALVQVQDRRLDPERAQARTPPMPEQAVLREPDRAAARRTGGPSSTAGRGRCPGTSASSSSSGTRPTSTRQTGTRGRRRRARRFSRSGDPSGGRHPGDGQVVRLVREPVLLLPPGHVEPLAKVAAAVEEPDADHGQRLVARLLDDVAREHAEPARVEGQRRVDAELGAEERDRPGDAGPRLVGAGEIRRHVRGQRLDPRGRATRRARPPPASSARGRSGSAPGCRPERSQRKRADVAEDAPPRPGASSSGSCTRRRRAASARRRGDPTTQPRGAPGPPSRAQRVSTPRLSFTTCACPAARLERWADNPGGADRARRPQPAAAARRLQPLPREPAARRGARARGGGLGARAGERVRRAAVRRPAGMGPPREREPAEAAHARPLRQPDRRGRVPSGLAFAARDERRARAARALLARAARRRARRARGALRV